MTHSHLSRWAALGALALSGLASATASSARLPETVPGEVVVGFHTSEALDARAASAAQGLGVVLGRQPRLRAARLRLRAGASVQNVIENLRRRSDVAYAEPVYVLRASSTPNDTSYSSQWSLPKTQTNQSWDVWQPQSKITVAVVDTGVDVTHPDLTDVLLRDGSGNAVTYNAQTNSASPTAANDDNGHGTHCAGTIAARINNARGVAGVAGWNPAVPSSGSYVQVLPVKVLGADGSGTDADVAEGIIWAADHGARVISMSLGGAGSSTTLANAVSYARSKNVVVVAAAGNESTATKSYPAAYPGVISVAATDSTDTLANFSNFGDWVKVAAPGVSIYSTYFGGRYATMSGTSMATPHVAGEVAAILAQNPNLSLSQVETVVVSNVDPYIPYNSRTIISGAGRINVLRALQAAGGTAVSLSSVSVSPTSLTGGSSATGTVTLSGTAPTGGTAVSLFSNVGSAVVPAAVTVPAGQSTTTFTVTTSAVSSVLSATITATVGSTSRTATLQINAPSVTVALSSLAVSPTSLTGGAGATGTVTLTGAAPSGGITVALASGNAAVTVPTGVTLAAGATSGTFAVTTQAVSVDTNVTLTANYNGSSRTATLLVQKPTTTAVSLSALAINPTSVTGGASATGTVTLSGAAPSGGVAVTLSRTGTSATVPASVTVPAGASSATFTVQTASVSANTSTTVTASYNGTSRTATLGINAPAVAAVRISVDLTSVRGGGSVTGRLTLPAIAASTVTVTLSSSSPLVTVPHSLTIPAGYIGRYFAISTSATAVQAVVTLSASLNGTTSTTTLTVRPPSIKQVSLQPARVAAGGSTVATVTLEAPAPSGGLTLAVSTSSSVAQAPATVTVPAGKRKVTFKIKTHAGSGSLVAGITVTAGDAPASTQLKITGRSGY